MATRGNQRTEEMFKMNLVSQIKMYDLKGIYSWCHSKIVVKGELAHNEQLQIFNDFLRNIPIYRTFSSSKYNLGGWEQMGYAVLSIISVILRRQFTYSWVLGIKKNSTRLRNTPCPTALHHDRRRCIYRPRNARYFINIQRNTITEAWIYFSLNMFWPIS